MHSVTVTFMNSLECMHLRKTNLKQNKKIPTQSKTDLIIWFLTYLCETMARESFQTFKEQMIPILYNLSQKIGTGDTFSSSFYEASITLIPKADKDITKKENYRPIHLMNRDIKILKRY